MTFLEVHVGNHPPEVAGEVQKLLYCNQCGVWLGAHNAPDGEEPTTFFGPWSKLCRCLHTSRRTPCCKRLWGCEHGYALCTRPFRLCHALRADVFATVFREYCCGSSGSHYLSFLEEGCDAMLASADACGVGLAAVSGDVVESTNYISKKGYNGHSSRGGGAAKSAVEREEMVSQQFLEWWFLTFDPPLLHYNTPHTAACTAPSLPSTTTQAPSNHAPYATYLDYSSPIHGRRRVEEDAGGEPEGDPGPGGMLFVCCFPFILRS